MKIDHKIITDIIKPNTKVLDLGTGCGELLALLIKEKNVDAHGVEIDEKKIYNCVENNISVYHGDFEDGLKDYPDKAFDYVILNQSLQEAKNFTLVFNEALRIGNEVIIGFPNFAYLSARLQLFFKGRTPITKSLPYRWYNTPNLRFLSILDFKAFCTENKLKIHQVYYFNKKKRIRFFPNLFGYAAIFVVTVK